MAPPPVSRASDAPGRASASSSAAAVGNRSSAAAQVARATTSSSQAGTAGTVARGRKPVAAGVGRQVGRGALGKVAGERVVEREAHRVEVGARVAAAAGQRLGGGVGQGARERAAPGDAELAVELGGAEIGEAGAAVGIEQDVLRLDVAVEDAVPVRGAEGGGDVAAQPDGGVGVEPAALGDPHLEIRAADVLHHDEAPRPLFEKIEDRDDVRVGEPADRLYLAAHPLAGHLGGRGRRDEQLEGDVGVERPVAREVDDRVAAAADLADDLVAALEQGAGREIARRGHGAASRRRSTSIALLRQPSSAL